MKEIHREDRTHKCIDRLMSPYSFFRSYWKKTIVKKKSKLRSNSFIWIMLKQPIAVGSNLVVRNAVETDCPEIVRLINVGDIFRYGMNLLDDRLCRN